MKIKAHGIIYEHANDEIEFQCYRCGCLYSKPLKDVDNFRIIKESRRKLVGDSETLWQQLTIYLDDYCPECNCDTKTQFDIRVFKDHTEFVTPNYDI